MNSEHSLQVVSFVTDLGWMALVGSGSTLKQLVFGHHTQSAALAALDPALLAAARTGNWCPSLVDRLQDFAAGGSADFRDVQVDLNHLTPFQRKVVKHCRAIAYGQTRSYGELALQSGSARAARAVGNTMATNRYPLIVPCHRVVHADRSIGHLSAPDGSRMKTRLLDMEERTLAHPKRTKRAPRPRASAATRC
ncbi:MAG: methylated-DNA--[protein]-cysteine S-methyltransferase [Planctomycetia bacterium]|nr:methylated-DNA--[protein]-cysteine S-methyltransferase [Planctomycetia bacterium]